MIDAVCWDVGGVFSGRPVDAVASVAADHGLDPADVFEAVFGPYHLDGDHVWHRLERGELPLSDAWAEVERAVAALGGSLTLPDFFARFGADTADREVVRAAVRDLASAGLTQAIITNNVAEFSTGEGGGWRSLVPMSAISLVIDSSEVGVRKPDPAIFELTLARLGVDAARTVFLDDMEANVEAARGLGMHGIVVGADPGDAIVDLRELVGL